MMRQETEKKSQVLDLFERQYQRRNCEMMPLLTEPWCWSRQKDRMSGQRVIPSVRDMARL